MRDVRRRAKRPLLRARNESGAVLPIVALSLIALMGMVVISVDVGGVVVQRRYMVNANDAASLAAAQAFALNEGGADCAGGFWTPAQDAADNLAQTNVPGTPTKPIQPDCAQQTVTTQYAKAQELFFAPVLGFGSTANVAATATAQWGSPGVANPLPIVMYEQAYNNCKLDTDGIPGSQCYVWEDNSNTVGPQSAFGLLNLGDGWDVAGNASCPNPGTSQVSQWIKQASDVPAPLNYPEATYVCRVTGMATANWQLLETLAGKVLFFPLNRCYQTLGSNTPYGQVDTNGSQVTCPGTPDKYDIIGFVAFRLLQVYTPNDVSVSWTSCASPPKVTFPGATGVLSLDVFGIGNGCFSTAPDQIDSASVKVDKGSGPNLNRGPDGSSCAAQYDWCYDPGTRSILWKGGPAGDYNVSFNFRNPGPCGYPPSGDNAGHCLVLDFVKKYVGGSDPLGGFGDSNLQAVALIK
jgi:Flp pilus assembly protein TadG